MCQFFINLLITYFFYSRTKRFHNATKYEYIKLVRKYLRASVNAHLFTHCDLCLSKSVKENAVSYDGEILLHYVAKVDGQPRTRDRKWELMVGIKVKNSANVNWIEKKKKRWQAQRVSKQVSNGDTERQYRPMFGSLPPRRSRTSSPSRLDTETHRQEIT